MSTTHLHVIKQDGNYRITYVLFDWKFLGQWKAEIGAGMNWLAILFYWLANY